MSILITGSGGFVGQNLSKYLEERDVNVQRLSLKSPNWKEVYPMSTDAVIHLAGKAHDTSNTTEEEEYFRINRDLTLEVFDSFLKSEARDFFFFSSVKAVADSVETELDETATPTPKTPYGISKWEAEELLLQKKLPEGKRLFIIRPCMIHGPGNKGNLNLLYELVKKGIPWPLAKFHNERSFLSIENLNYLIHQMLLKEDLSSGVFNFSDDGYISTNKLIELISVSLGKLPKYWNISPGLIEKVARVGDKIKLPLNTERLQKLTENYRVSNGKVKSALGIDALPVSAEDGLVETFRTFRE